MVHGQIQQKILREITEFVGKSRGNSWFIDSDIGIYLRMTTRKIENDFALTLDLANVNSYNRGKGYFTAFLIELEAIAVKHSAAQYIYIESVLTPRFADFFRNTGYTEIIPSVPACFYKRIHREDAQ